MSNSIGQSPMGYSLPSVFEEDSFEYDGSYEEKKKQIKGDILIWQAVCISGQKLVLKKFEMAMKKMGDTLEHSDFMKILEETDQSWS
jgi:hypothetical protein